METSNIHWEKPRSISDPSCRLLRATMGWWEGHAGNGFGIDPGVNFGISYIFDESIAVFHGSLAKETTPGKYAVRTMQLIPSLFKSLDFPSNITAIVEGAAYNKTFGQVGLEEVRIGFYLALMQADIFFDVKIVAPATIRKAVFNNYLQQAMDIYPQLHHNGADAFSMAQYSIQESRYNER